MKTPPLLMAATLLFWGWETDMLIPAGIMAIILESSHLVRGRWELSLTDLNRVWDLCILLFLGVAVILYTSEESIMRAFKFAQWQPYPFFPIMLAQAYGSEEKIRFSVFSWFLRRMPQNPIGKKSVNISYIYMAICVMAASAANRQTPLFYIGIVALFGWALLAVRPKRAALPIWFSALLVIAVAGNFTHQGMRQLQTMIEGALGNWIGSLFLRQPDTRLSRTSIGDLGRLKLSGNIILRVHPVESNAVPSLLREVTYESYKSGSWWASRADFGTLSLDKDDSVAILPKKTNFSSVRISQYFRKGRGILAVPHGTFAMRDIPALLQTNRFGVVRSESGPDFINYIAEHGDGETIDSPPRFEDLEVPESEQDVITEVIDSLKLKGKTETEKLRIIAAFFANNFSYSLELPRKKKGSDKTALGSFLTESRFGHCEYFATATVLMLREAGIFARYATGFAVQEDDRSGDTYLVRERHGHAWVLFYSDESQQWENFDTTPASWSAIESERASFWEPVSDFWSRLHFEFSKWRWGKESYARYLIWLLIPLVIFLAWRILFRKRKKSRTASEIDDLIARTWPGMNSQFYLICRRLEEAGLGRTPEEPLPQWKRRVEARTGQSRLLDDVFALHNRLRFDPNGLQPDEEHRLKSEVDQWLLSFEKEQSPARN